MEDAARLLEHRIPDVVPTDDLPFRIAAEIDFLAGRVDRWLEQSGSVSAAVSARSLAFAGHGAAAHDVLVSLDVDALDRVDLAAAVWAASRVGGMALEPLRERVDEEPDGFWPGDVPVGPKALWSGMLRGSAGDLERAAEELGIAVRQGDAQAPLWGALARLELGRVLRTAEAVPIGRLPAASPSLGAARTFFAAGGYRSLSARIAAIDEPVVATLDLGRTARIGFGVQPAVAVRSSKGLKALEHLVRNRGRIVTAAELAVVLDGGDTGELAGLSSDLWRGALENGTLGDGSSLSEDLRRVFFDERTRSRVSKLLRRTIDKLGEAHPLIGRHLTAAVSTGHRCRYEPAGSAVAWAVASS